jgi:hypothetical protein
MKIRNFSWKLFGISGLLDRTSKEAEDFPYLF